MTLINDEDPLKVVTEVAQQWIQSSLIADHSVFSADTLWSAANVEEVRSAFVDHPDEGSDDFSTKLRRQMESASPAAQRLMAEMLWSLLLFPSNINPPTKRELINQVWSLSGESLPQDITALSDLALAGVGGAGVGFNTHRWRELVFEIYLVGDLKRRDMAARQRLFDDYEAFVEWINRLPQGNERQFRHMLRYFAFPDRVEKIASNQEREAILQGFKVATAKEIKTWTDKQIDDALFQLRTQLQNETPEKILDFYEEPWKNRWRIRKEKLKAKEKADPIKEINISFTVEDCRVFSRYPNSFRWMDIDALDQERFKSIRNRLKQLAETLAEKDTQILGRLKAGISSLNPHGRSPGDIWSCVYPLNVPNKSYGLQVALIISERGCEICFCRGAGTSQVNNSEKKNEYESALIDMLEQLKSAPAQLIASVERGLKRKWYFRRSWRSEPNVSDFDTFREWFEFLKGPNGNNASSSVYLTPVELEQIGTSLSEIFEEGLQSFGPILNYAYSPAIDGGSGSDTRAEIPMIPFDAKALSDMAAAVEATQFNIEKEFLSRFVCALVAKPFVILTGNSGTGKTKLAELFVRWLCRDVPDRYALLAVGADWTDNRNVVGFVNHLRSTTLREDGIEVESPIYQSTRILDLLLTAGRPENLAKPHFLILDEMNLSHVERYFADLLSATELQDGALILHREGRSLPRIPGGPCDVPETIRLPHNLFVIGTVNVDETTYMFSPKVLDRANVIEFRVTTDAMREFMRKSQTIAAVDPAPVGYAEGFLDLSFRVRGWTSDPLSFASYLLTPSDAQALEDCRSAIDDLFSIMQKRHQEFAFRTMSEIFRFLVVAYELTHEDEEWDWKQALDAQILQKVLPKLHGSKRKIGSLLAALAKYCEQGIRLDAESFLSDESKAESYLAANKREESPLYQESYLKLCEMMEAVRRDQFVSFIQ